MTVLSAVATVSGILLILVALNDVFQTLLRPSGTGRLTHLIFRLAWSLRRTRRVAASAPLTILAVIIVWVSLVTVGWALIYLPHMPDGFAYQSVDASDYHPFAEALTMSMVALTTLGLGDVVPSQPVLRFVSPLEALMGFALLSASVSWFMQVYPALARRRAFDLLVHSLSEARTAEDLAALSAGRAADLLTAVTDSLSTLTADLVQNSEIFYFGSASERMSAPPRMQYVLELRDAALSSTSVDVRAAGRSLSAVIEEVASLLKAQYPHVVGESTEEIVTNVAIAHAERSASPPRPGNG